MNISKKTSAGLAVQVEKKMHRIFVIDVSGSMYSVLPKIKNQLKNKIPQLTNIGDLVTAIYFSSRGQCGTLIHALEVNKVTDFIGMNTAIDRYIKTIGCTGFCDPLREVKRVADEVKKTHPDYGSHMFFMTDGYDNEWSENQILADVENLVGSVDSASFVEYGWYCNRALITKMADRIGASVMFTENFDDYDGAFVKNLTKKVTGTKKKEVDLGDPSIEFAFTKIGDEIISYSATNGKISVPETVSDIYFFSSNSSVAIDEDGQYAAAYTLAQRMKGHDVLDVLGELGDVRLIDMFTNCFSKQDYSNFQTALLEAIVDPTKRFVAGKNTNYVPAPDCPTVSDLLDELASDSANKFHPYDPNFSYDRISAEREVSDEVESVKFTPYEKNGGYTITDLVFNENRANISIKICIDGYVTLPVNQFNIEPKFDTKIFRNYAMVKDGIKHTSMNNLPMELCEKSFNALKTMGVIDPFESYVPNKIYYINANLPVVNRKMATDISAKEFFERVVELQSIKSAQKVYNTIKKNNFAKTSEGFIFKYGKDATDWLATLGVTESGFAPKMVKGESTDVYKAVEFDVAIKSCSAIPPINDKLMTKVSTGAKVTLSESLCVPAIKSYNTLIESPIYKGASDKTGILKAWIEGEANSTRTRVRELIREVAKTKFAIMVGHTWFSEFSSMDENSMTVSYNNMTFDCSATCKEIEVNI